MKKNKFNPGKRITIFFVFFAFLFFSLGLWQIERGQAKTNLLDDFEKKILEKPSYINQKSQKWDRVYVEGKWDSSKQILIDNVIRRGIAGYKVLTPLRMKETDQLILVDRGWIKQNTFRDQLPDIKLIQIDEVVSGILEIPELGLVLSDDLVSKEWPKISQTKNLGVIKNEYDENIFPMILLADPTLKNSLEYIKITPTNMTPIKHYGYSAQWFLMFLVLCFMYVWYGYKRNAK
ncbi:MAG: SURF1 family protein [SAR86 cluster bacterium]|jgi:surfeit locus 1 family protein|uniref:SURF1-like protein n=1 Tax=SAR86 cluster bacterium TaxID=2030880 RepID=A0A520MV11_9GAMM|nr:MAG: SURF1 family protein [SAR86 cluster bacterium]|tara:strand:- start:226 stop:927 length:702 start_codon:yes stop_codon:yes gene_type:complete